MSTVVVIARFRPRWAAIVTSIVVASAVAVPVLALINLQDFEKDRSAMTGLMATLGLIVVGAKRFSYGIFVSWSYLFKGGRAIWLDGDRIVFLSALVFSQRAQDIMDVRTRLWKSGSGYSIILETRSGKVQRLWPGYFDISQDIIMAKINEIRSQQSRLT